LSFRLFWQTGALTDSSFGSPGLDELRWLKPVRPGDTLHVKVKVLETRRSTSKPDRGVVRMVYTTLNQHGEAVMTLIGNQLLRVRPQ
jgi:acyl dehydratase